MGSTSDSQPLLELTSVDGGLVAAGQPLRIKGITWWGAESVAACPEGLDHQSIDDLLGGTKQVNAQMLRDVMGGQKGPVADNLNLNAGVALAAAEVAKDIKEGVAMAQEAQQSGKAGEVLTNWIELSQAIAKEESP